MISSIFGKTKPVNFIIITLFVFIYFLIATFVLYAEPLTLAGIWQMTVRFLITIFTIFLIDFISKKNKLSKNNHYIIFFYVLTLCMFPQTLISKNFMLANLLVLLAVRRLLSLRSFHRIKLKILDATLFIGIASLYYDWVAAYLLLVYLAIVLYGGKDYRNWLVPIMGAGALLLLVYTYFLWFDETSRIHEIFRFRIELNVDKYGEPGYLLPSIFISILGTIGLFSYVLNLKKKLAQAQTAILLIVGMLVCGVLIAVLSDDENTAQLIFAAYPLAIIMANYIERRKKGWIRETLLASYLLLALLVLML